MASRNHALAASLDAAADSADAAAGDQRAAAREARNAARAVRGDRAAEGEIRQVLRLLGRSIERLTGAAGAVRRVWARTLADRGLPLREIGDILGVSHQRVSALLGGRRNEESLPRGDGSS